MRLILLVLLTAFVTSCHTVKKTVTRSIDSTVTMRPIEVRYDTAVTIKGKASQVMLPIPGLDPILLFPDTTIQLNGIQTTISIKNGKVKVTSQTADTTVQVNGKATGYANDTRVHETVTITKEKQKTWFGRLSSTIKDIGIGLLVILILAVIVLWPFIKKSINPLS